MMQQPLGRLGILGGGQLGRMLALAAADLGIQVQCLDPAGSAASAAAASQVVKGHFRDPNQVIAFAKEVAVLTAEIEHVNVDVLQQLEIDVQPTPKTLAIVQDKFAQKQHVQAAGIPVGEFCDVPDRPALLQAAQEYGYPLMLKSKRLAYDGRGNYAVKNAAELEHALQTLGGFDGGIYAEKWQPFARELAVIAVRSRKGELKFYPVTETVQTESICHLTETPAQISRAAQTAATRLAEQVVTTLDGAGAFGVELFLLADGKVLFNEVAPRVHNSGHYTIDGCVTSQFSNHIRAVMNLPLGDASLKTGHVIMLNILGQADGEQGEALARDVIHRALQIPGCSVHWYDKRGVTKGRKLGHINIVARTPQEARDRLGLLDAAALARLSAKVQPKVGIIMGSDSDLPTMKEAAAVLEELGIACEVTLVSAHRTPERLTDYARSAYERGIRVIVAGAGGAAHLPGMVAAQTSLPVIGVPVVPQSAVYKEGFDALLSMVQMPSGVPVATVAIGNGKNGGLLAARLLAASDPVLYSKLLNYQETMRDEVIAKAKRLEAGGYLGYEKKDYVSLIRQAIKHAVASSHLYPGPEGVTNLDLRFAHQEPGCVLQLRLPSIVRERYIGKVRDRYHVGDQILLVTTDRLTAFDRAIANIPFKGAVLNLISEYWFKQTASIMPNHMLAVPHPNVMLAKAATPFKVEFVVREYLTGSCATSIWTLYQAGQREFGGLRLPDGMNQHQQLPRPIVTPTTKSEEHDQPLTPDQIVQSGLMTQTQWETCSAKALELFAFARECAAKRGLILVDSKMEMGVDANGELLVIDELFTPDSSRYWLASHEGQGPKNIDKEFIRLWLKEQCDPYKDAIPNVPEEMIVELSRRYILLYEMITGQAFPFRQS